MFDFSFVSNIVQSITNWTNVMSGGNQMVAATLLAGIYGVLGWVSYLITKKIPALIARQLTCSLIINNASISDRPVYNKVNGILKRYSTTRGVRIYTAKSYLSKGVRSYELIPGLGVSWLVKNRVLFKITKRELASDGVDYQKEQLTIRAFTRNPEVLNIFLEGERLESDELIYKKLSSKNPVQVVQKTPTLDTLALDSSVKFKIRKILDTYTNGKLDRHSRGLHSSLRILLHGEPGNGKTALVGCIARELNAKIIYLSSFQEYFNRTVKVIENASFDSDEPTVVVLEDIHSYVGVLKEEYQKNASIAYGGDEAPPTLSAILNLLGGSINLNNVVIIMTTNYLNKHEPSLYRPGRVDYVFELPRISPETCTSYLKERVPGWSVKLNTPLRGSDLSQLLISDLDNPDTRDCIVKEIEDNVPPLESQHTVKESNVVNL